MAGEHTDAASGERVDRHAPRTGSFFLSSIWMSGYGIAADPTGNLFFSTGNSATGTYDGVRNIQESVVKLDPQLGKLLDIFTPSNENSLDAADEDVSAGGVLLLPPQPGPFPNLAVATAKSGNMYLLNRDNLGGFTPGGPDKVLDTKTIGPCWCGPSYFTGSDGIGRVVSSGCSGCTTTSGATLAQITVWKVQTSPTVAFVQEGAALPVASGQDGGTFTAVSSNGTMAGTTVIWATGEPVDSNPAAVNLYAFGAAPSGGTLPLLYSSRAGSWPNTGANANIVPVVANGKVYVASNKQLTIFGLGGHSFAASAAAAAGPAAGITQEFAASSDWGSSIGHRHRARAADAGRHHRAGRRFGSSPQEANQRPGARERHTRRREPMIRPARCMQVPSRGRRVRPHFGRRIADASHARRGGRAAGIGKGRRVAAASLRLPGPADFRTPGVRAAP